MAGIILLVIGIILTMPLGSLQQVQQYENLSELAGRV